MQSFNTVSSSSFVNNNILKGQSRKLGQIIYPLVKYFAELYMCNFINFSDFCTFIGNKFNLSEINSYINFFASKKWKESYNYNQNWEGGFYIPSVVRYFFDFSYTGNQTFYKEGARSDNNIMFDVELRKFILGSLNRERSNLVQTFNYAVSCSFDRIPESELVKFIKKAFGNYTQLTETYINSYINSIYTEGGSMRGENNLLAPSYNYSYEVETKHDNNYFYDLFIKDVEVIDSLKILQKLWAESIDKGETFCWDKLPVENKIIIYEAVNTAYEKGYWRLVLKDT